MKGSKMIQICSILLLISGIFSVIAGGFGFLAMSFVAAFGGPVILLVLGCLLVIVSGVFSIKAGNTGRKNCSNPGMANTLVKWGILIMGMSLLGNIFQAAANESFDLKTFGTMLSGLIVPGLYTFGAWQLLSSTGQKFSPGLKMPARQQQNYQQPGVQGQAPAQPQQTYRQPGAQGQAPVQPQQTYQQPGVQGQAPSQPQQTYQQPGVQSQAPSQPQPYVQAPIPDTQRVPEFNTAPGAYTKASARPSQPQQTYQQPGVQGQAPSQPQQTYQPPVMQDQAPVQPQQTYQQPVMQGQASVQPQTSAAQPENGSWVCPKCGYVNASGRFCGGCGTPKNQAGA